MSWYIETYTENDGEVVVTASVVLSPEQVAALIDKWEGDVEEKVLAIGFLDRRTAFLRQAIEAELPDWDLPTLRAAAAAP